jgi:hypothetical protein
MKIRDFKHRGETSYFIAKQKDPKSSYIAFIYIIKIYHIIQNSGDRTGEKSERYNK